MPESYLALSASDQKDILQTAAVELGKQASVLEKDIWICWVLHVLFSIPDAHPMAFKGGTSLSKVYNIIDRFSEDVDITLDYRYFEDNIDPFVAGFSRTQVRKFSDRLKEHVKVYANNVVVPFIQAELEKLCFNSGCSIDIDNGGEKIWLSFPSVIEAADKYLKSQVLIELGGRNVIDPNERHTITAYVAKLTPDLVYPVSEIVVLSPERTFWEKATLIHVECSRGKLNTNSERLSRHWYDLVQLSKHYSGQSAIKNRTLLEDVVRHKKLFFNSSYANYDACLDNQLKLLPEKESIRELQKDYEKMIVAGMIYQAPMKFAELTDILSQLEIDING